MTSRARKLVGWATVAGALAAVFALYTRPAVMVMLADQFWACFR